MYAFRTSLGPVDLAFTDRLDGVSAAPWDSLDLALDGDGPAASRAENLRRVLDDFAPHDDLADLVQVHGADVVTVGRPGESWRRPDADAVVASRPGVTLLVRAADCVPVLLADPVNGVVGAAHAGRLGLQRAVVPATVARMRELGARDLTAWIGPSICGGCYEVPSDLQEGVAAQHPAARSTTTWGTPALDIAAGVRAQLHADDVAVIDADRCTRESPDLFSYRRDGRSAGRHAGLIRLARSPRAGSER